MYWFDTGAQSLIALCDTLTTCTRYVTQRWVRIMYDSGKIPREAVRSVIIDRHDRRHDMQSKASTNDKALTGV
jgi:hypothetical protein